MIFAERRYELNGRDILLRSAAADDADMLKNYLKTVCGETRFLMREADEVMISDEDELKFINSHNDSETDLLILAFVDGEYAGNCSFEAETASRRNRHRAGIGIALFQKYTGLGLGRLMLTVLLEEIRKAGFEQAELTVVSNNERARHLYESLGFRECGRIPNANKYDDGSRSDNILMVLPLK